MPNDALEGDLDPNSPFRPYPWPTSKRRLSVYFLYYSWIIDTADGALKLVQKAYFKGNGPDQSDPTTWTDVDSVRAQELAKELTENARLPAAAQNPQAIPLANFYDNRWHRVGHIIMVMDTPGWAFSHNASTNGSAIHFYVDQGSKPNHSFYDGELFTIMPLDPATGRATPRSAASMINYMVDEHGVELGRRSEPFRFKMAFATPTNPPGGKGIEIDPGGTNDGPPIEPPPIG